ncbi:hypothetical protein V6Z11_A03G161200, partial [Gossypium hirsutum]
MAPFELDEFRKVVYYMQPDKSPRPNGLCSSPFFSEIWKIIGNNVVCMCTSWVTSGSFPLTLMNTLIILILKVRHLNTLKDLLPICLCNVLYKIVSEVL